MKIHKYALFLKERQVLELPYGARILDIQNQAEVPVLWAIVDPNETKTVCIPINCYMTGSTIEPDNLGGHIATVQFGGGGFFAHFFRGIAL